MQAAGKEKVLDALGKAAAKLRGELGESLRSVQKFDVPLEQATTSSLEALKAFSLGRKQNSTAAVPYYERAIELDPKFASAYLRLGIAYSNLGQTERGNGVHYQGLRAARARERARKASHRLACHYWFGTGELDKAIQTYTLWAQSYPRDWLPFHNLGGVYSDIGQYEKAAEAARESLRLYPDNVTAYENLGMFYLALNRFPEARDVVRPGAGAQARRGGSSHEPLWPGLSAGRFRGDGSTGSVVPRKAGRREPDPWPGVRHRGLFRAARTKRAS